MAKRQLILSIVLAGLFGGSPALGRDLEELQREFLTWKFGMFIHFNMSTFVPGGWSSGTEDPLLFHPTEMDFGQWADAAKAAKMKYGVLTVKHTGGWCLWDTATSDRDITWFKNYKDGKGDMVKEFTDAFRARGLKVGVYYCFPLWGEDKWKDYQTLPADNYAEGTVDALSMIKTHFTELLTNYGDIDIIWIDQSGSPNGGLKPGDWRKIKAHMHALQPNCLVVANNAMDLADTDIFGYEYPYSLELPGVDNRVPTEVCDKLNNAWFANPEAPAVPVRTVDYVVNKMLRPLNDRYANLLLNCAPEKTGRLHPETVAVLKQIGEKWDRGEPSHAHRDLYDISRTPIRKVPTSRSEIALMIPPGWTGDDMEDAAKLLAAHKARATFFVNEATAKTEKGFLRRLVAAGHALGNGSKSDTSIAGKDNARLVRNEVDAVQKQLRTVQSPMVFRAPGFIYDDYTWPVLNYLGLEAVEPAKELTAGAFVEVSTLSDLETVLKTATSRGLVSVTAGDLFAGSSSERLSTFAAQDVANVVTGRE